MALNAKALGLVAVLGGGGIGIPLYLKSAGKSPVLTPSPSKQVKAAASVEARVIEKAECSVSAPSPELESFLQKQQKEKGLYSTVSCKNTILTGDDTSLLESDWMGLFAKTILESTFSVKEGDKFEMKVETEREEGMEGTKMNIEFKSPKTTSSIRGRLGELKTSDSGKRAVEVTLRWSGQGPKEAYIFIASANT